MSSLLSYEYFKQIVGNGASGFTNEGGVYITLINKTGSPSIRGTIISISTNSPDSASITPANSYSPSGIIIENDIADGNPMKVAISGKAFVLLKDSENATSGYWCSVSDTAGRMIQQLDKPTNIDHNKQIGYSLQTLSGGNNVLCLVNLIFN